MNREEKIKLLKDVIAGKIKPDEVMPFKVIIWNKEEDFYKRDGEKFTESEFEILSRQSLNEMHVVVIPPIEENI